MRRVESIFLTYNGVDGRWRAGNGEAIQATLVDGGGGFLWSFGLGSTPEVVVRQGIPLQLVAQCGGL
jgi:hypothetical protein